MKNGIKALVKLHERGNVMITGEKGSGKDVMTGNIVARIPRPYVSNMDYTRDARFNPLDFSALTVGGNTFRNFLSGEVNYYEYPYEDGTHIYISDAGNYFPAQYCGVLDRDYAHLPVLFSLIRQLGEANIHTNAQAYERVWNKLREQSSDAFIRCDRCRVLFGKIVFASYYFYDRAESCQNRVKPCRVRLPLFATRDMRLRYQMHLDQFYNNHGTVQRRYYVCWNKSKHDTRLFKEVLKNGKK